MKKRIIAMLVTMAITATFTACQQAEPKVEQNGSEATQSAPATTTVSESATEKISQTSSELSETVATESASETEATTAEITEAPPIETTVTAAPIQTELPKQTEPSHTQPPQTPAPTPVPTPAPTEAPVTQPPKTEAPVTTTTTFTSATTTEPKPTYDPNFDVEYWVEFGKEYAASIGLIVLEQNPYYDGEDGKENHREWWSWDNPIGAHSCCIYLERDIKSALDYYKEIGMTHVCIWSEPRTDYHGDIMENQWEIYIGYA